MEFLYKLYSNDYFGIGLFIVITLLAFLFLVILFFGKRDEKIRIKQEKKLENEVKKEKTEKKEELETSFVALDQIPLNEDDSLNTKEMVEKDLNDLSTEDSGLNQQLLENSVVNETKELNSFEETSKEETDLFVTSNIVLNTDYITEDSKIADQLEEDTVSNASDIYNLDSIINKSTKISEEETIDDVLNKYDVIEEKMMETAKIEEENNSILEENELNIFNSPNDFAQKNSTPFSSVYLTKEEAEVKEEEKEQIDSSMLRRPNFEMPKRLDLPKKSNNAINENIISNIGKNTYKDK